MKGDKNAAAAGGAVDPKVPRLDELGRYLVDVFKKNDVRFICPTT